MFLLIAIGILLVKKRYLSEQGGKDLGTILLRAVIPCVIVKSYLTEYSPERARDLAIAIALALLALAVAIAVSYICFGTRGRIENFGAAFCNVGFIGIPLIQAVLGDGGVFYLAGFIAFLNILQWTYGVLIMTGDASAIRMKAISTNPVVISVIIGMLIFFLRIPIPQVVTSTLSNMANLNTPLAMIILGTYLAKMDWKEIFTVKSAYFCVLVRLVVIPAATLFVLLMIPGVKADIKKVILIGCSTPVGSNIAIFAKQYDKDYKLSVVVVCLSTLLCVITVPVFYMFVEKFI